MPRCYMVKKPKYQASARDCWTPQEPQAPVSPTEGCIAPPSPSGESSTHHFYRPLTSVTPSSQHSEYSVFFLVSVILSFMCFAEPKIDTLALRLEIVSNLHRLDQDQSAVIWGYFFLAAAPTPWHLSGKV